MELDAWDTGLDRLGLDFAEMFMEGILGEFNVWILRFIGPCREMRGETFCLFNLGRNRTFQLSNTACTGEGKGKLKSMR
jgi:hypothetical protein